LIKRIMLLLTVASVMAAMGLVQAVPAFADAPFNGHNCLGWAQSAGLPAPGIVDDATRFWALLGVKGEQAQGITDGYANCGDNR
jgi:hypothetical protein